MSPLQSSLHKLSNAFKSKQSNLRTCWSQLCYDFVKCQIRQAKKNTRRKHRLNLSSTKGRRRSLRSSKGSVNNSEDDSENDDDDGNDEDNENDDDDDVDDEGGEEDEEDGNDEEDENNSDNETDNDEESDNEELASQPFAVWAWGNIEHHILLAAINAEMPDLVSGASAKVSLVTLVKLFDMLPPAPPQVAIASSHKSSSTSYAVGRS